MPTKNVYWAVGLAAVLEPTFAMAQQLTADGTSANVLDSVIVTGTRDAGQKARDSLSPVAVVTAQQLASTGQTNLRSALEQLSPSVVLQGFTSDLAGLVDTIKMRGLGPDQTLVLVNGKRRHTTATINNNAGPNQGSTGVDINMIPVSAIDHVEILKDGASAQYGSDAIAGVVNIILKSADHGGSASSTNGAYFAGDGFTTNDSVNSGFKLGDSGFLNLSAEFQHQDRTDRGAVDDRTGDHSNKIFGSPEATRQVLSFNSRLPVSDSTDAYAFGTYGNRKAKSLQNYRISSRLPEVYPDGFSPKETTDEDDYGVTVGLEGTLADVWDWDLSSTYGRDRSNLDLRNSANLGLYADTGSTPKNFKLGQYWDTQWTNNVDIRRALDVPLLASPLNLAFGVEQRREGYGIGAGDAASYYDSGSDAYQGISPANKVDVHRDVQAAYLDLSANLVPKLKVDLAGRYEHYSDVGSTVTGKVAARYQVNDQLALRSTVSSGFRAPSLAQENYTSIGVGPDSASGQVAVNSTAGKLLGASSLKPEKSTNFSIGAVFNPLPNLDISLDAYQITIDKRIVEGGTYSGATALSALTQQGVTLPAGLDPSAVSVQYFSNGADTRTRGLDLTGSYHSDYGPFGHVDWSLGYNLTHTKVLSVGDDLNGNPLLNAQTKAYLTSYTPRDKLILGAKWKKESWNVDLSAIRYGSTTSMLGYYSGANAYSTSVFKRVRNQPLIATNLAVGYQLSSAWKVAVGGENIFDVRPKHIPRENAYQGVQQYDGGISGIGINGGYYYTQIAYNF
ncbi:TonB-dependent receptor plug domain-containing protein [Pseudomonas typographi]|uniref:TonB-dependent receptor plug domain-containing protein n=2 Tax=Pseudomonas typographi TaxID=2715964 RepID=UPI0016889276|nr:TonB-dependent receptor [Pseudomonas typographi]MBD1586870.1 TonB-dependent receptor [Pseudomonas typographi]